jgi:hypothetical protein
MRQCGAGAATPWGCKGSKGCAGAGRELPRHGAGADSPPGPGAVRGGCGATSFGRVRGDGCGGDGLTDPTTVVDAVVDGLFALGGQSRPRVADPDSPAHSPPSCPALERTQRRGAVTPHPTANISPAFLLCCAATAATAVLQVVVDLYFRAPVHHVLQPACAARWPPSCGGAWEGRGHHGLSSEGFPLHRVCPGPMRMRGFRRSGAPAMRGGF